MQAVEKTLEVEADSWRIQRIKLEELQVSSVRDTKDHLIGKHPDLKLVEIGDPVKFWCKRV